MKTAYNVRPSTGYGFITKMIQEKTRLQIEIAKNTKLNTDIGKVILTLER